MGSTTQKPKGLTPGKMPVSVVTRHPDNARVAERLREFATLLEQQDGDRFRIAAYRRAAETIAGLDQELAEILREEGIAGLIALPNIGKGIARAIEEMLASGRWMRLERLRGESGPLALFCGVPGIGPSTAREIEETLHVDTLEALEIAAHDGRLEEVPGIGPRKAAAIRASLAEMLARRRPLRPSTQPEPEVSLLLQVDTAYRRGAEAGSLPKIAPKRFNPARKAWLPVLHGELEGWEFTVLFSNTARAHELGRTHDWVVIYFQRDHGPEFQRTVVTETRGSLAGERVVRGREADCRAHYLGPQALPRG